MLYPPAIRSRALAAFVYGCLAIAAVPVAEAVDTQMTIDTTTVNFGNVNVGNTASPISVTLTNSGSDSFGPINMFGGAPFTPQFNASQSCQGITLAAGASCTVTYTFSPTGPSSFSDTSAFTISETSSQVDGEDFSVSLTGVGVNPITAVPLSHDFGSVTVGTTSPPQATVISNTSAQNFGPINMFGGAPFTPQFNASQNCQGMTLPPGGTCSVTYSFSPTAPGVATDVSSFTISATASQSAGIDFSVALTGCGTTGAPCASSETVARVLAAAGSTPGNFGSFFRTGVQLSNPFTEAATGRFVYHRAGVAGSAADPSLTFTVAPGATVSYDDLVETMGQGGLGSLDVVVSSGANVPEIVARVYNDAGAEGTTGFTEEAIDPSGSDTRILFAGSTSFLVAPPNNTSLRYNIGVRTLTSGASVTFRVHDASGAVINTVTKTYDPTFYEQQSATTLLGAAIPPNASIEVSVSSGSAIVYGATIDNVTNDPSVQFARVLFAVL
jgi:hypothetical protein